VNSYQAITGKIGEVIVGQSEVVEQILIALLSRGHSLLVGVPGLAKTLLISTVADILDLKFSRIQFTPDLMPADITGTEVIEEDTASGRRSFRFIPGPVFAQIILADEINRTPPKTQAALLQAMQEYRVTIGGKTYELELPFFVLATQNPIEQEGTYPLPEAQLDRFFFQINIGYPAAEEEKIILEKTTFQELARPPKILTGKDIIQLQRIVRDVPVSDEVLEYVVRLIRNSRPEYPQTPDFVRQYVQWGAGPRAGQCLILGAKARALIQGRLSPSVDDVQALAHPVLRHRIILNFAAEAEGQRVGDIIRRLLEKI
jgi:MoxR-like ATPase